MSNNLDDEGPRFSFDRWPPSADRNLRAWNTADEWLLAAAKDRGNDEVVGIYHDRFGFLSALVSSSHTHVFASYSSEIAAAKHHTSGRTNTTIHSLLDPIESDLLETALIHIPKSIDLFEWYIWHAHRALSRDGFCLAGFMTRHFTKEWLNVAHKYFDYITQSKALKKSRVITMRGKKDNVVFEPITQIRWKDHTLRQYKGGFASDRIDMATQFLLSQLILSENLECVLDLGCGNGIIAYEILRRLPMAQIHVIDDSLLAIASARMNLQTNNIHFHEAYHLNDFENGMFDLIVTNPPFHFGYEIDISIPIDLFAAAKSKLSPKGSLVIVANRHLNYMTHLIKIYPNVSILAQNQKFIIYDARLK